MHYTLYYYSINIVALILGICILGMLVKNVSKKTTLGNYKSFFVIGLIGFIFLLFMSEMIQLDNWHIRTRVGSMMLNSGVYSNIMFYFLPILFGTLLKWRSLVEVIKKKHSLSWPILMFAAILIVLFSLPQQNVLQWFGFPTISPSINIISAILHFTYSRVTIGILGGALLIEGLNKREINSYKKIIAITVIGAALLIILTLLESKIIVFEARVWINMSYIVFNILSIIIIFIIGIFVSMTSLAKPKQLNWPLLLCALFLLVLLLNPPMLSLYLSGSLIEPIYNAVKSIIRVFYLPVTRAALAFLSGTIFIRSVNCHHITSGEV